MFSVYFRSALNLSLKSRIPVVYLMIPWVSSLQKENKFNHNITLKINALCVKLQNSTVSRVLSI